MAWTPFSYEAVELHVLIGKIDKAGRVSDALEAINAALQNAHADGPSNVTYEQAEAKWNAPHT